MARVITISIEITSENIKDCINSIQGWNLYDNEQDEKQKDFKRETIHIMINTYGGDAYSGLGLATMIKSSKTPIYTYCVGEALSAGLIIFLGGHKKYCYQGSSFLYHQLSQWTSSKKLNNFKRLAEWDTAFQARMDDFVIKNSKIAIEQINEVNEKNHDWYMSAQEALDLGIVDEIL